MPINFGGSSSQTERQIANTKTRLRAIGVEPPEAKKSPMGYLFDALRLPSDLEGRALGQLTGHPEASNVKEAVQRLLEDIGVSGQALFEADLPWFGGAKIHVAPSLSGIGGTMAEIFNPLDPINWLTVGLGKAAATGAKGIAEAAKAGEVAAEATRAARPVVVGLKAPFMNRALEWEPGSLLGPLREPVSQTGANAWKTAVESPIGQALGQMFSTNFIPKDVPSTVPLRNVQQGLASRLYKETGEAVFGEKAPLGSLRGAEPAAAAPKAGAGAGSEPAVVSGREAARTLIQERKSLESGTRALEDEYERQVRSILQPFGEAERRSIMRAMAGGDFSTLPEHLQAPADALQRLKDSAFRAQQEAGIPVQALEQHVPFIPARALRPEEAALLNKHFGTGISEEALASGEDALLEKLRALNPHLKERTTKGVYNPEVINSLLKEAGYKPWLSEDLAQILSLHGRRTIRATQFKKFVDAVVEGYGLKPEEAMRFLGQNTQGWGLYEVKASPGGFTRLEPVLPTPAGATSFKEGAGVQALPQLPTGETKLSQELSGDKHGPAATAAGNTARVTKQVTPASSAQGPASVVPSTAVVLPKAFADHINAYADAGRTQFRGIADLYNTWLSMYKTTATVMLPRYWLRNKLSDVWQMWLAGVRSPAPYEAAAAVLKAENQAQAVIKTARGTVDGRTVLEDAQRFGLLGGGQYAAETSLEPLGKFGKALAPAVAFGRKWVDDHSRLTLFIDRLMKGDTPEQAAAAVKTALFDYFDLTPFERKVMRNVIPFYTWWRKNVPYQLAKLAEQPGKFATVAKAQQVAEGPNPPERPAWLDQAMAVGLPGPGGQNGAFLLHNLPFVDVNQLGLRDTLSKVSPLVRVPFELAANQNIRTGAPISERGEGLAPYLGYALTSTVPIAGPIGQLLSYLGVGEQNPRREEQLFSLLSGVSTYPQTKAAKAAEQEELDRLMELLAAIGKRGVDVPTITELRRRGGISFGGRV